ncbi:hydroxymyristoyl-ACP dehydratase [Alteribacter lacisalsi]|uniref:Hydroxymyristoyl-ACP dehydratase n=2 Tax=Alteribacter lacisalsi TaxID=2045244 RepID=A0A2W0H6H1_9BACI|nr:hydroxymyristoyl-ACP dehydratase [Alteribacter lacisalsi]
MSDKQTDDMQPMTREEIRKRKLEDQEQEKARQNQEKKPKSKRGRVRLIPIWFRLILVVFLVGLSILLGAMVGYGIVGDGHPMDVFQRDTWNQIYELIYYGVN